MARGMGIGQLGRPDIVYKRQFRFLFTIQTNSGFVPEHFVKIAARPGLSMDEEQVDFLNGRMFIPGKGTWDELSVTYYDVADSQLTPLYSWIASVYNFLDPLNLGQTEKQGWAAVGSLSMLDGCGNLLETWTMRNMWPKTINFGTVDYGSSEIATIELGIRFNDVTYISSCQAQPQAFCVGC